MIKDLEKSFKKQNLKGFTVRIYYYLVIMLVGILFRTYVTHSVSIVWIVNAFALFSCFYPCYLKLSRIVALECLVYLATSLFTLVLNIQYFNGSLKAVGSNINIIVLPIYLILINYVHYYKPFNDDVLETILRLISLFGIIAFIFAWLINFNDIVGVFLGRIRAYRADIDGFFYHKNVYGAFLALSLGADLYLYELKKSKKRLNIIILKVAAIVMSLSRAALLQTGLMVFVFWWTKRRHRIKDIAMLMLLILIVVSALKMSNRLLYYLMNSVLRLNVGDAGRAFYRHRALSLVNSNLLSIIFGVGYAGLDELKIDIDNTYLYLLFTGGVFKVLFWLGCIVKSMRVNKKLKTQNPLLYRLTFSMTISYLVYAYFESVAVLELGILNFINTFYIFFIPNGYTYADNHEV